jgi:DNA-binding CsgD family transcriptional regulator
MQGLNGEDGREERMHSRTPPSGEEQADAAINITTLSERQMQVLALVADGRTDNEIAIQLGLSAKTITSYVAHIRRRFEAQSRAQAVALAIRQGLLPDPDSPEEEA